MSLWTDQHLPVLRYLDENPPANEALETNRHSTQPHADLPALTEQEFHYAVKTLEDAGYITSGKQMPDGGGGVMWLDFQVTGAGKQILGQWPLFEALGQPQRLAAVLDELAKMAATDEEANLQQAAEGVRRLGADALEQAAAGALSALVRSQT